VVLLTQDRARRHVHLVHETGGSGELAVGAPAEQVEPPQQLDGGIGSS
jgi:hypothetical protein